MCQNLPSGIFLFRSEIGLIQTCIQSVISIACSPFCCDDDDDDVLPMIS